MITYCGQCQQTPAGSYEPLAGEECVEAEESPAFKSLLEQGRGVVLKTSHGGSLSIHAEGDSYSYSYCYGPRGITGLLRSRYAVGCALFASIGGLSFGYDQGVIANVLVMRDFLARWPVGPWEKGLMSMFLPALKRTHPVSLCSLQLRLWSWVLCLVLYRPVFLQTSILGDILYSWLQVSLVSTLGFLLTQRIP